MGILQFFGGERIEGAAERLVAEAKVSGSASGSFNEIELTAAPDTTLESIVEFFNAECDRRREVYRNSPEGQTAERESNARRAAAQATHDTLMRRLQHLDMTDQVAVLAWLCEMQDPSDLSGVVVQRNAIVAKFEAAGYQAGVNCGEDFRRDDRDNVFRWLVGQALSGLKDGPAIHSIIHKFADEWRRDFMSTAA